MFCQAASLVSFFDKSDFNAFLNQDKGRFMTNVIPILGMMKCTFYGYFKFFSPLWFYRFKRFVLITN